MSGVRSKRTNSVLNKLGIGSGGKKAGNDPNSQQSWLHPIKDIRDGFVSYQAKFLGTTEVPKAKGVEIVRDAIKKLKIARQVRKSEAGNKGSKLQKVEINISIDSLKVVDAKSKQMICGRPLHRVSYCADDHSEKKLFAFIAKEQETKTHHCFVFICEKMASDLTLTLGQAFQMAYRRYVEQEKADIKKNKEMISLEKEIEKMKSENEHLRKDFEEKQQTNGTPSTSSVHEESGTLDSSVFFDVNTPPSTPQFQSLSNPFPTSPTDAFEVNGNLFDAHFSQSNGTGEAFDPFGTAPKQLDFGASNTDDFFSDKNGGISIFDVSKTLATNTTTMSDPSRLDFEPYDFGRSPKEQDFIPKIDPFADTPDWESVASEEVPGSSQPANPFAHQQEQQDPFAQSDPFGNHQDPFAQNEHTSYNQNPFNQNTTTTQSIESTQLQTADLFSEYLSKVATRDDTQVTKTTNNNVNFFNSFDTYHTSSHITGDYDKDVNNLAGDVSFVSLNDTTKSTDFPDVFGEDTFTQNNQETEHALTVRPRPSGVTGSSQSLPAPPTKQALKSTIKSTPQAAPRPKSLLSETATSTAQYAVTPAPRSTPVSEQQHYSTSHVLPNVRLSKGESELGALTRVRTRSQNPMKPLKDSITNASKSLEDLAGLDDPSPSTATNGISNHLVNPFQQTPNRYSSPQFIDSSDFFKEVHSPEPVKPSFASPYATFEATI